jgi:hypothetical protein
VQRLAWDVTEVAELREEVTQARATTVMVGTCTVQAERMAQERAAVLVIAHSEVSEAAQRVSALEGELVAPRRARDVIDKKITILVEKWPRPNGVMWR